MNLLLFLLCVLKILIFILNFCKGDLIVHIINFKVMSIFSVRATFHSPNCVMRRHNAISHRYYKANSVCGYRFRVTNLLKHVKDKYGTIQDPGQSGRSSGGADVVVVVLVVAGGLGLGLGLDGVTPETPPLL
jgi:hypothetical protein